MYPNMKMDRAVFILFLSTYTLIAPIDNLARHYMDYEQYKSRAESAGSVEENKFWNGVSGLVKQRMKSNEIFIPGSYEIKRVRARYVDEKRKKISPIPNTIESYIS